MAFEIKYNIYYSTSELGPWILGNNTPIDYIDTGNEYTINGLKSNVLYYFLIIGGYQSNSGFVPLVTQHIGLNNGEATGIGPNPKPHISAKTFTPKIPSQDNLSHKFTVII